MMHYYTRKRRFSRSDLVCRAKKYSTSEEKEGEKNQNKMQNTRFVLDKHNISN